MSTIKPTLQIFSDDEECDHDTTSKTNQDHKSKNKRKPNERDRLLRRERVRSTSVISQTSRLSFELSNAAAAFPDTDELRLYKQITYERKQTMTSVNQWYLLRSFRRYTRYNGVKFIILTSIVIVIAVFRQLALRDHYNPEICQQCYQIARQNKHNIFEWQTCAYYYKVQKPTNNVSNLSVHHDLFASGSYYIVTAVIVAIIAALYAIISICCSYSADDIDELLRKLPLECLLSYNIIVTMICFYQIAIDYQYYLHAPFNKLSINLCGYFICIVYVHIFLFCTCHMRYVLVRTGLRLNATWMH